MAYTVPPRAVSYYALVYPHPVAFFLFDGVLSWSFQFSVSLRVLSTRSAVAGRLLDGSCIIGDSSGRFYSWEASNLVIKCSLHDRFGYVDHVEKDVQERLSTCFSIPDAFSSEHLLTLCRGSPKMADSWAYVVENGRPWGPAECGCRCCVLKRREYIPRGL